MPMDTLPVTFNEMLTPSGLKIGHCRLTKVSALNALDMQMVTLLRKQLKKWQQDDAIVMVLLDGEGDRGFCAGGDVVSMFHAMKQAHSESHTASQSEFTLEAFFSIEYELDHLIHTFSKPVVVWGNGIVMGGGLGLMCGASHRIVTSSSRIAMPEITIGLYPDVGASYFLNKMPDGCGLFLGLTAANINAADALYTGLADYFVTDDLKLEFFEKLLSNHWQTVSAHKTLDNICKTFQDKSVKHLPESHLKPYQNWLHELSDLPTLEAVVNAIKGKASEQDPWFIKGQKALSNGSAVAAHIVFEQLRRGKNMSLAECLRIELGLSCKSGEFGEFQEGVRALLVDKDGKPNWKYKTVEEVPESVVKYFFEAIWPRNQHPLQHLR